MYRRGAICGFNPLKVGALISTIVQELDELLWTVEFQSPKSRGTDFNENKVVFMKFLHEDEFQSPKSRGTDFNEAGAALSVGGMNHGFNPLKVGALISTVLAVESSSRALQKVSIP